MNSFILLLTLPLVFCDVPHLPTHIKPIDYNLVIVTHLPGYGYLPDHDRNMTFEGEVAIELEITQSIDSITLHAAKNIVFDITDCFVVQNDSQIPVVSISESDEYEQVVLTFSETIHDNIQTTLFIGYKSPMINALGGILTSAYEDRNNATKIALFTQFEPNYARYAIPCFDEPELKAPWTLILIHPRGTTALSNTQKAVVEEIGNDMTLTSFETTPIMSSYLLAFVVSDFEYKTALTQSGISVRVYAPPKDFDSIDFALNVAVKSFDYYENKTGINFPISKVDLIGFERFPSGAMENWGLIIFRDGALYSKIDSTILITAHEIAHQWFGNLVTASWWDEIWLNEGFARLYQFLGSEYVTDGRINVVEGMARVTESYINHHELGNPEEKPTTKPIETVDSFMLAFDSYTTYDKGAAIINMFRNAIGQSYFDETIINYLKGQSYSNANSSVFYSYFEMPTGGPSSVSDFLQPWFNQVGHPLITVNSYNTTHDVLTQTRFDNKNLKELDENVKYPKWGYQWDIPVWYSTSENANDMVWLLKNSSAFVPRNVKINPTGEGIFKVMYNNNLKRFNLEKWRALESMAKMRSQM